MVSRRLGLSVGLASIHAVLLERGVVQWAGQACYESLEALSDAVGHLAAEAGRPVTRARVALERAVVQLRAIVPAPPLKRAAVRRYVTLEASRLFRKNGVTLVTDGRVVVINAGTAALWAAAAPEPLVQALLAGCAQAGLRVEALGPAADVLPAALDHSHSAGDVVLPTAEGSERLSIGTGGTWRSRLVPAQAAPSPAGEGTPLWQSALGALGPDAGQFAAAFAVCRQAPQLDLTPPDTRAARERVRLRRTLRVVAAAVGLWMVAGGVALGRLLWTYRSSTAFLETVRPQLDSALAERRELDAGRTTLETIAAAERTRSRRLGLLAGITHALGDSAFLVMLRIGPGAEVRFAGYAPQAAHVLASLEHVKELQDAKLEGPVTREAPAGRAALDRFAVTASLVEPP